MKFLTQSKDPETPSKNRNMIAKNTDKAGVCIQEFSSTESEQRMDLWRFDWVSQTMHAAALLRSVVLWMFAVVVAGSALAQQISTVAGGSGGNGVPATAVAIPSPTAVAVDRVGNLYIADPAAYVVRKMDVGTCMTSIVAGNGSSGFSGDGAPATAAQ